MVWAFCLQPRWPLTAFAWSWHTLDLQLGLFPQPMHTLSIDLSRALEDCPSAPVAIARVLLCQRLEFDEQFVLVCPALLVMKGCTLQLSQLTGTTNRASIPHQVVHYLALFGNRQLFLPEAP